MTDFGYAKQSSQDLSHAAARASLPLDELVKKRADSQPKENSGPVSKGASHTPRPDRVSSVTVQKSLTLSRIARS